MLPDELRKQFPLTAAAFADPSAAHGRADPRAADEALRHIAYLDQRFRRRSQVAITPRRRSARAPAPPRFDVVLAGGGLSLIYAVALGRAGHRVAVFDRRRIGCGHREWNISRDELRPLVESGLFTAAEVERLVRMQYESGFCRFAGGGSYSVRDVLDCVIDAEALLTALRERATAAGVVLLDHHELVGYSPARFRDGDGIDVHVRPVAPAAGRARPQGRDDEADAPDGAAGLTLRARLFIDGLGAASPHARFDLCCPTVGGVLDGLQLGSGPLEMDPSVGEILVTTEGIEAGQQHIWEGFPAPPAPEDADQPSRRMTVYLFYYARPRCLDRVGPYPLLSLYERFFETLPRYKRGPLRLLRPTYGYIPAYTRLGPMPAAPSDRVFLVGDAAGRHSPLTFCGFGSMIRSFWPVTQGLLRCLRDDQLDRATLSSLWREPPALQVLGGLTLMMSPPEDEPVDEPEGINQLLDAAFAALHAMGQKTYAAFLKDDFDAATFVRFMLDAAARHPAVYRKVFVHLSPTEVATWLWRLGRLGLATRGQRASGVAR
ncbi:MAG: lycopene cyclase [Polyangia bacterium]